LTNCRNSFPESALYAFRSFVARRFRLFSGNVTLFIAVSNFLRDRLILAGYPAERIEVVQNAVSVGAQADNSDRSGGSYIGYAGRLSFEKGADTLVEAARICRLPVKIAGDGPEMDRLRALAPPNVEFLGRVKQGSIAEFYSRSRFTVVPSRSYEGFPLAAAESMMHGKPVIGSRIGALPELIQDGGTGLLFGVDNPKELALKMRLLWEDQGLCIHLGNAAGLWAKTHCQLNVFYERLMTVYERAIRLAKDGLGAGVTEEEPLV
jgi:glycosyltransferase involved in cell wall biosynthesis